MRALIQYVMLAVGFINKTRPINYLTSTVAELVTLLDNGTVTSEQLVTAYLSRIDQNNHQGLFLRAVIEPAPYDNVIQLARIADDERRSGVIRGPLHGIPILIKDNIATHPSLGMSTTAGSFALGMFCGF